MSNSFARNPIVLDSVMASGYEDSSPPNNLDIYPRVIRWIAPTTAGHQFEIDDKDGNLLFKATCTANGVDQEFQVAEGTRWAGLWKLITLQSGTIYLYFST